MSKKSGIKLPGKQGRLLISKDADKLKKKYPEGKYTLTSVITADGAPVGFLLQKVKTKKCVTCGSSVPALK